MAGMPCWDHHKCGQKVDCPAYPDNGFNCWLVEGTLCRGERQPAYERKIESCRALCDYYMGVMDGSIKVT